MLGLEHETSRGSITIEYYGRNVGLKIMPTGEPTCAHAAAALLGAALCSVHAAALP